MAAAAVRLRTTRCLKLPLAQDPGPWTCRRRTRSEQAGLAAGSKNTYATSFNEFFTKAGTLLWSQEYPMRRPARAGGSGESLSVPPEPGGPGGPGGPGAQSRGRRYGGAEQAPGGAKEGVALAYSLMIQGEAGSGQPKQSPPGGRQAGLGVRGRSEAPGCAGDPRN